MSFVQEAFESNYIAPLGPQVDAFEREFAEYVGIPHAVALSSGTAAMPWLNTLRCPAEFNGINIWRSGFLGWGRGTANRILDGWMLKAGMIRFAKDEFLRNGWLDDSLRVWDGLQKRDGFPNGNG